jgi:hypothetical protein
MRARLSIVAGLVAGIAVAALVLGGLVALTPDPTARSTPAPASTPTTAPSVVASAAPSASLAPTASPPGGSASPPGPAALRVGQAAPTLPVPWASAGPT